MIVMHPAARLCAILASGAVTASLLSGCTPGSKPGEEAARSAAPGLQHIHALVVDPGPGDLLVATHAGLYQVTVRPDGSTDAEGPIGGLDFDPMGFTVAGDTAFASGHPGPTTPATFGNPNMGLISSTDLGRTWTNVSLTGQTDFHALSVGPPEAAADTGVIYGLDSGAPAVRRSADGGATWSDGADLVARDILADAANPGTVYATTEQGLAVSIDGAETFAVDAEAPALYLLGAAPSGLLAGIGTDGTVWRQKSAGSWVPGGTVTGAPQAMTIAGNRLYVADDRGIAMSEDWGASWTVLDLSN